MAKFELTIRVGPADIDEHGHVNNTKYVEWMQQAASAHSAACGWSRERYTREGVAWVVRSHQIKYLQPAFVGESIRVCSWIDHFKRATSVRRYTFHETSKNRLLAKAETLWAFLDLATRTLSAIPPDVLTAFQDVDGDSPSLPDARD